MKATGLGDSPLFKQINPTMPSHNQEINLPRNHDTIIVKIYQAVIEVGREASTYRLSLAEKKDLLHITYSIISAFMAMRTISFSLIAIPCTYYGISKREKEEYTRSDS